MGPDWISSWGSILAFKKKKLTENCFFHPYLILNFQISLIPFYKSMYIKYVFISLILQMLLLWYKIFPSCLIFVFCHSIHLIGSFSMLTFGLNINILFLRQSPLLWHGNLLMLLYIQPNQWKCKIPY